MCPQTTRLWFVDRAVRWLSSANPARINPLSAFTYYAYSAFTIQLSRFFAPSYLSESAAHVKINRACHCLLLSGKCSLPSAAACGIRSAWLIPIQFSRCPWRPWLAPRSSSDHNLADSGAKVNPLVPLICQSPTGTQGQGLPL